MQIIFDVNNLIQSCYITNKIYLQKNVMKKLEHAVFSSTLISNK